MQTVTIERAVAKRAKELIEEGKVNRVMGWQKGEFFYDNTPAVLTKDNLDELVYNSFCGGNLSKYLIEESKRPGKKILALLTPGDTYSFNQLVKENRIQRKNVYVLGIPNINQIDIEKIRAKGMKGIIGVEEGKETITVKTLYGDKECKKSEVLLEKSLAQKAGEHVAYDEILEVEGEQPPSYDRMAEVRALEQMSPEERFAFWRKELSKCIRCNACRNVCPACSCNQCVFDNPNSGIESKANTDTFEENMFHIIRAYHVAGRCTDCGECSRVCPEGIPLHLLNRKFIKDINEFYGEYQAGADDSSDWPLVDYTLEDAEPNAEEEQGGKK